MAASHAYIAQTTFVANFEADVGIRYKLGEIERAFQSVCAAQAVSTNVPDSAPSSIPRFTLQSGPKNISISQISAQFDLDFSDQRKSLKNTFEIIEKNVNSFWNGIRTLKRSAEIGHAGLILAVNIPSSLSREKICEAILTRYSKVPIRGQVASAAIQFGYLDSVHKVFTNISLAQYQMHEGVVHTPPGMKKMEINVDTIPVKEKGFETKIDINSRPMTADGGTSPDNLGEILLARIKDCLFESGTEFFEW